MKEKTATWKNLTVTGGDDKSEIGLGLHVGLGQGNRKAKPQRGSRSSYLGRRYTALFPNNNALRRLRSEKTIPKFGSQKISSSVIKKP